MCHISFSEVKSLGNSTRINERCLELQKSKRNGTSKMKVRITGCCSNIVM